MHAINHSTATLLNITQPKKVASVLRTFFLLVVLHPVVHNMVVDFQLDKLGSGTGCCCRYFSPSN